MRQMLLDWINNHWGSKVAAVAGAAFAILLVVLESPDKTTMLSGIAGVLLALLGSSPIAAKPGSGTPPTTSAK